MLTPVDHPDPAHCIITGTGLTHLGSAAARDGMHKKLSGAKEELTDSLKMFQARLEGGKPKSKGEAGVQPEWFYKGDGSWLVGPGQPCRCPPSRSMAARAGTGGALPDRRQGPAGAAGFALGNEYSDHVTERQNYLYLAHSKLRHSSIGLRCDGEDPGLGRGHEPHHRGGKVIWEKPFLTGEANMSHTIANLEFHHFKYDGPQAGRPAHPLFRHGDALDRGQCEDAGWRRVRDHRTRLRRGAEEPAEADEAGAQAGGREDAVG